MSRHLQLYPPPFFAGPIYAAIFWSAYALWIIPEIIASRLRRSADSARIRDRGSLTLIIGMWWIGMVADFSLSFVLPQATISWRRSFVFLAGIFLMLVGTALRWYSVAILGRHFTFDVAIAGNHALIEAGPYRHIRHPSYSGALVTLVGFGLALGNWMGLAVFFCCMALAYAYRIPVEEAALTEALGESYRQYMRRTWRLVPFLY